MMTGRVGPGLGRTHQNSRVTEGMRALARWNPPMREELVHGITRLRLGFGVAGPAFWETESPQELWTAGRSRESVARLGPAAPARRISRKWPSFATR